VRLPQSVLMQHVACHGEEVGLRASDGFVVLDPEQPQEDLLSKIWRVGVIAHADGKEPSQPLAVAARDLRDK